MSEYWKSNAKKYCDYCKVWIADNKASIGIHESGNKHKQNVKAKLDEIKKNSIQKRADEKKYNESMAAIEKAAMQSMKNDLDSNPSLRKQYGSITATSSTAASAEPTSAVEKIEKKVEKKSKPAVKSVTKPSDQAAKRKNETLPEAKIGKWQKIEEPKPVIQGKFKPIDLQLPTNNGPAKSIAISSLVSGTPITINQEVKTEPVVSSTQEVKSKWTPIGESSWSTSSEPTVTSQELTNNNQTIKKANTSDSNELNIKTESVEIKVEPSDSVINNEKQQSGKKEKTFAFKKRKNDSIQLRTRTDD